MVVQQFCCGSKFHSMNDQQAEFYIKSVSKGADPLIWQPVSIYMLSVIQFFIEEKRDKCSWTFS